jgi:phage terminase small subunit
MDTKTVNKPEETVNLVPKMEKFCQLFVKYKRNITKAYMEAYDCKNEASAASAGSRLLKNIKILARIAQLEAPIIKELQIDAKWVLERSIEIVDRCMQKVPVIVNALGGPTQKLDEETGEGVWDFDANGANKALDRIAKHTGGFIDRQDHTTAGEKIAQNIYNIIDTKQKEVIEKLHEKADDL